jgi:hypothetical protein
MTKLRIRVSYEECPDCSWLEQWDTAEKYYGGCPECPACGCGMDYHHDHLWQCSDNREEYNGECDAPLLEWKGNDKGGQCCPKKGDPALPFDEYRRTYGDPNNYVYLYAVVESLCEHCGEWGMGDSLSGIDFYEPAPDHWETGTFTEADVDAMPEGYFRDTLKEMLENVKAETA